MVIYRQYPGAYTVICEGGKGGTVSLSGVIKGKTMIVDKNGCRIYMNVMTGEKLLSSCYFPVHILVTSLIH